MALLLFGIPPQTSVTSLLETCAGLDDVERVVVERSVARSRRQRWVMLSGAEGTGAHALLAALTESVGSLLVVVGEDEAWRILGLTFAGGRPREEFEDFGDEVRSVRPEATMRGCLRERTTAADAKAIDPGETWFGTSRWDHYVRSEAAHPPFAPTTVVPDDLPYAVDWVEVYDWSESEGLTGPDGLPTQTPEHLDTPAQLALSSKGDFHGALALVDAQLALEHVGYDPDEYSLAHYNRACFLCRLGRVDEALESLGESVHAIPSQVDDIKTDPDLEAARAHPSFEAVIEEALRSSFMGG
jgi:hypothetical protein